MKKTLYVLAALTLACSAGAQGARAQAAGQSAAGGDGAAAVGARREDESLRRLLEEVRQLRLAIQSTTVVAYRVQFTLDRVRLQQERLGAVERELEGARQQLSNTAFARGQYEERAKEMEEQLRQESEEKRRQALELQLKEYKRILALHSKQEERQREREAQLAAQLQTEQLRLGELNAQLDGLEREMAAGAAARAREER